MGPRAASCVLSVSPWFNFAFSHSYTRSAWCDGTKNASSSRFLVWESIMRVAFIVLPTLILCACGPQPESSSASGTRIYDTQRSALEKAKTVNDTVTQGAEA